MNIILMDIQRCIRTWNWWRLMLVCGKVIKV